MKRSRVEAYVTGGICVNFTGYKHVTQGGVATNTVTISHYHNIKLEL